ncbi:MAG: class I SAM-dependent methyltransferase [Candidatus Dormibacteraeota bacterium]|nr:class I SAM-dependent methyltransferase [Candidatus Dormibacteraeota bacterium]
MSETSLTKNARDRLSSTFDCASDLYQGARPEYPAEVFERLTRIAGLRSGDRLLELGCATGKATLPLAERGFRITCIEPGPQLAAAARRNLAAFPGVDIVAGRFEDWPNRERERFDLVFAATAWHWIDPAVRYSKAWEVLRARGHLAFWAAVHVFPEGGDRFFIEIQDVYDEIGEGWPAERSRPRPGELKDQSEEIDASGLFRTIEVRHFDWEQTYDADGYVELLETFSGHLTMERWQRDRLYGEIRRRLEQRHDRSLRRHWGGVLHIARRQD